jgi:hypothetical protein
MILLRARVVCALSHRAAIFARRDLGCSVALSVLILSLTRLYREDKAALVSPHSPKQNHVLAALRDEDALPRDLELVPMSL